MVRQLPEIDEVKLIGSDWLAAIPVPAATLAARLGVTSQRDPDFLPGLGTFEHFSLELDQGVTCTIASDEWHPDSASVFAHSLADLPAIARALGVPLAQFDTAEAEPPKPWLVVRLDDNGNQFVLNRCRTEHQARRAAEVWARRIGTHHQAVLVEPAGT